MPRHPKRGETREHAWQKGATSMSTVWEFTALAISLNASPIFLRALSPSPSSMKICSLSLSLSVCSSRNWINSGWFGDGNWESSVQSYTQKKRDLGRLAAWGFVIWFRIVTILHQFGKFLSWISEEKVPRFLVFFSQTNWTRDSRVIEQELSESGRRQVARGPYRTHASKRRTWFEEESFQPSNREAFWKWLPFCPICFHSKINSIVFKNPYFHLCFEKQGNKSPYLHYLFLFL